MADTNTYQAQANELSQKLWAIANELRGQMDASEFKNYILGVIFYRYLSERTEMYMAEILENDGVAYEEAFADDDYRPVVEDWSLSKLGYVIKPENLFRNLIRKITKFENDADKFSVEDFEKAINDLVGSTMGHESNKAFDGLFNDMRLQDQRLGETVADRTDMIGRVMVKVSDIDFDLQDSQFDVLGTAYMILIGLFASDAGKKGGEFFTPAGPSRLCATLASLGLDEAKTVGDCTCGSASMLLEVQKHLTTHKVGHFYGQEQNATTYNLSRMNMIMHGDGHGGVHHHDGLLNINGIFEERFDVILTNPPFGKKSTLTITNEDGEQEDEDLVYNRQDFWTTSSNKQFNFVQHIHTLLKSNGKAAVVLPDNVLFEEGSGGLTIRKKLLETTNLHTILRLPTGIFYKQGVKANVLFFDNKPASKDVQTKNIWIYDLRVGMHFTLKKNPIQNTDLDDFVKCYNPENIRDREETWSEENPNGRWRKFTYEFIKNNKYNLDIKWISDDDNLDGLNYLAGKKLDYVNKKAMEGTIQAHVSGDVPNIVIELEKLDEENIGELIYFFEKACGLSGYLLGVNPFDQPGVEAYKKNMFALLGKPGYESEKDALEARLK